MKKLNGFKELQIEDSRKIGDDAQHATLMNITGASGAPYSSGEGPNFGKNMPCQTCGGTGGILKKVAVGGHCVVPGRCIVLYEDRAFRCPSC